METIERIDRYLSNELQPHEAVTFEQDVAQNPSLRRTLEAVQVSRRAVQVGGIRAEVQRTHAEFMAQLRAERQQAEEAERAGPPPTNVLPLHPQPGRSQIWGWTRRMAASVLLLLLGYAGYQATTLDEQTIYQEVFMPYQLPTTRGTDAPPSPLETHYRVGDFTGVVQRAATLPNKQLLDHFLTGMAHLQLGQHSAAAAEFAAIEAHNRQRSVKFFEAEADYYQAIAYLGAKQYGQAYARLQRIRANPDHPYRESVGQADLLKLRLLILKK